MKCFSIDLDGTLLNSQHEISEENLKVLQYLKEQGHSIIFNTGRAYEDVVKFEAVQKIEAPIFSINGTVLYSASRDVLHEASLSVSIYKELFPILKELGLWMMIYTNQGGFPCRFPMIMDKSDEEIDLIFKDYDYDSVLQKDNLKIYKVMAVSRKDQLGKIDQAKQLIQGKIEVSMASSHPNNVEFTSIDATKGKALLRYQQQTNQHFDEIYAFGDGGNDISQFKVATTSVAMANAPFYIQQEADVITKTNDEDGFAYAVRHLINI
ncbi:hydrolase [Anaerobacillus alkalidiazotrophicus]|uniref:Hydrolase n=1 Tax=Anaerobacillus alkalidiazotrophicus TaxID=472963 RepID=A0A1S2LWE4_9BACI|nr:Cof-type HAD-IIB family hydrolase [Anaerobacillus alkalidiazotrophicus]OIJ16848.1 hydrolase [Anaerobacillus alkalidiazotrophicus]